MFDWIRRLFPRSSRPQRRRQAAYNRRCVRLHLESLEDRITPATFNPTDAAGLQTAFTYANSNPTEQVVINLTGGGAYNLADIGSQLLDQSTAGITINGNDATITAAANSRIFEVDSGDRLALNNLTVTGGNLSANTAQGGGIADFGGAVTLSAVNVTQNTAWGGTQAQGGGLYVMGGSLTLENGCLIANNQADGGYSTSYQDVITAAGGGIYVAGGILSLTNSTVRYNVAQGGDVGGSAAYRGGSAAGGGLFVAGNDWNVTIADSTLTGNSALGGAGGSGAMGAPGGSGGSANGGGAYVNGNGSRFSLSGTAFSGNKAQAGGGGTVGGQGGAAYGGGLDYAFNGSSAWTIQQSSFDSNNATGGSGGTGSAARSGGSGGAASGGGLYLGNGTVTLLNCSVTNDEATAGSGAGGSGGVGGQGAAASGGGIANVAASGGLTLMNTTLGANTAQGGNAGAGGYLAGTASGGGLYQGNTASTLINDTIAFNAAVAGSGGQGQVNALGGGIYSANSPTLTNVILESNSAATGSPDFYGMVGTSSGYDFISNTSGIGNASALSSMPGMILNNTTPQLDTLTEAPGGLAYYPLLANSQIIGAGTTSAVDTIATQESVPPANAVDEIGNPRVINNTIAMGAIEEASGSEVDTYTWDPTQVGSDGNYLANNPQNWLLNSQQQTSQGTTPGYKSTDIAQFDGNISNAAIEWNQDFTFSTMVLGPQGGGSYTGQQTIDMGDMVELTGIDAGASSVSMDDGSSLNVFFGSSTPSMPLDGAANALSAVNPAVVVNPVLKLDGSSTWPNFNFTGNPDAQVILNGGTTKMGMAATDTANVGVQLVINKGATLRDLGFIPITLTASNLVITDSGEMDVYFGTGTGITLIQPGKDGQGQTFTGCYIDVTGGTLKYVGTNGKKDTFAIPVLVEKAGTFSVTTAASSSGGWLIVTGQVQQTQKDSVYMTSGGVKLSNGTTLECDDDYRQVGGNLSTGDNLPCTLQDQANGKGTAVIAGGIVQIAPNSKKFGELDVNCGTLDFAGEYIPRIAGGTANSQDSLKVNGIMNIDQKKASLSVTVVGDLKPMLNWTIITATNNLQSFPINNEKGLGLTEQLTTSYVLKS